MVFLRNISALILILVLSACDKGYQVRFSNYYVEPMDSVTVGGNTVVFKNIPLETTTELIKIKRGKYDVVMTTSSKKKFYTSIWIPGKGSGNRTIQIDAITQIVVLED